MLPELCLYHFKCHQQYGFWHLCPQGQEQTRKQISVIPGEEEKFLIADCLPQPCEECVTTLPVGETRYPKGSLRKPCANLTNSNKSKDHKKHPSTPLDAQSCRGKKAGGGVQILSRIRGEERVWFSGWLPSHLQRRSGKLSTISVWVPISVCPPKLTTSEWLWHLWNHTGNVTGETLHSFCPPLKSRRAWTASHILN